MHYAYALVHHIIIRTFITENHEDDAPHQKGYITPLFLCHQGPEGLYETIERQHHQSGKSPEEQEGQDINHQPVYLGGIDELIVIGDRFTGQVQLVVGECPAYERHAEFLPDGPFHVFPVLARIGHDGLPGDLAIYKYIFLQHGIIVAGVRIRLVHAQPGLPVMGAVGHHLLAGLGVEFQQLGSIEQAGITVSLAGIAEYESRDFFLPLHRCRIPHLVQGNDGLHLLLQFLLQEAFIVQEMGIQGVIVICEAVRHHFQVTKFRRKAAQ